MRREEQFKRLVSAMSPELQGLVTTHCYSQYVLSVPFFKLPLSSYEGLAKLRAGEELKIFTMQVRSRRR